MPFEGQLVGPGVFGLFQPVDDLLVGLSRDRHGCPLDEAPDEDLQTVS